MFLSHLCQDIDHRAGCCHYSNTTNGSKEKAPLQPETLSRSLTGQTKRLHEGVSSSSGAREGMEDCSSLFLLSQDEYMADLYHFSTKEDIYANYIIKVSPLSHFSPVCECNMLEPSFPPSTPSAPK